MRRTVPELPEVTRGKHQAGAEMMLPDTVHDDARGKRVRGIGDRLRKLEALLAFVEWPRLAGRKDGEEARGRRIAFGVAIASDPDKLLRGVGVLFDDLQKRILRRERLLQPVGLGAQIGQVRLPGAGEISREVLLLIQKDAAAARFAEGLVPQHEFVARERFQIRLAQIVAARIASQRDVIAVVDRLLLLVGLQKQLLKLRRLPPALFGGFGGAPSREARMIGLANPDG